MTETQARASGRPLLVGTRPMSRVGRAVEKGETQGFIKIVADAQTQRIGDQTGGRVFLFLQTDDFWRDYKAYVARGVHFLETPREESYATVAVFQDTFGNRWDLLQPKFPAAS